MMWQDDISSRKSLNSGDWFNKDCSRKKNVHCVSWQWLRK